MMMDYLRDYYDSFVTLKIGFVVGEEHDLSNCESSTTTISKNDDELTRTNNKNDLMDLVDLSIDGPTAVSTATVATTAGVSTFAAVTGHSHDTKKDEFEDFNKAPIASMVTATSDDDPVPMDFDEDSAEEGDDRTLLTTPNIVEGSRQALTSVNSVPPTLEMDETNDFPTPMDSDDSTKEEGIESAAVISFSTTTCGAVNNNNKKKNRLLKEIEDHNKAPVAATISFVSSTGRVTPSRTNLSSTSPPRKVRRSSSRIQNQNKCNTNDIQGTAITSTTTTTKKKQKKKEKKCTRDGCISGTIVYSTVNCKKCLKAYCSMECEKKDRKVHQCAVPGQEGYYKDAIKKLENAIKDKSCFGCSQKKVDTSLPRHKPFLCLSTLKYWCHPCKKESMEIGA